MRRWLFASSILAMAACSTDGPSVSLTISFRGAPLPGRLVYFQEADSTLVDIVATDDNGIASARVGPGGYVTTVDPYGYVNDQYAGSMVDDVRTIGGVQPGDKLTLHLDASIAYLAMVEVPVYQRAVTYEVQATCARAEEVPAPETSIQFAVVDCDGVVDVGVTAKRANGIDYLLATDVPLPLIGEYNDIDLSARSYNSVPVANATTTWTHVPPSLTFGAQTDVATNRGSVFSAAAIPVIAGATATLTQQLPQPPDTTWSMLTTERTNVSLYQALTWAPVGSDITVDLADTVGRVSGFMASPATRTVTWTADAGAPPDVVVLLTNATHVISPDPINPKSHSWRWELAAPHGNTTSITFPLLPDELATFNWAPNDSVGAGGTVAKVPGGYDAVRADILATHGKAAVPVGTSGQRSYATNVLP